MVKTPRIIYGLHEQFVLFPYERGARRSKLVIRCSLLRKLLRQTLGKDPIHIGAPLVLGELLHGAVAENIFVPVVATGQGLNAMKSKGAEWGIRHHRVQTFADRSLRFETGTRTVYATHTPYYSYELLLQLTEVCNEAKAKSRSGLR